MLQHNSVILHIARCSLYKESINKTENSEKQQNSYT